MKLLIKVIIFALIACVMLFTCPEKEKHVDKLTQEIVELSKGSLKNESDPGLLEDIGSAIVGTIGEKVARLYVNSQLEVDNYALFSVGKMYYNGEKRMVTFGIFNHVFCIAKVYELRDEIKKKHVTN